MILRLMIKILARFVLWHGGIQLGREKLVSICHQDIETISNSTKVSEKKICTKCRQDIGRGMPHSCTANSVKKNIVDLISKESISGQEQIVGEALKSL